MTDKKISDQIDPDYKYRSFMEVAPDAIVVADSSGHIVLVNSLTEKMFGHTREELLDRPVEVLVPDRFKQVHVKHRDGYFKDPKTRPMGAGLALAGKRKDGKEFPVEISLSPLQTDRGVLVISIIRDITDRRRVEEQIRKSLREKEALLREIHHRVKNNLQVTSSLLHLQSNSLEDEKTRTMFRESQNRIRSMALVHEKLYRSKDLSHINFKEYIGDLAQLLFRSYGVSPSKVSLHISGDDVFLTVETAVPCGLLINELVSNCLKHAFPGDLIGDVSILVNRGKGQGEICLEVSDNGVGLPSGLDIKHTESLGLQLVQTLIQQINGVLKVSPKEKGASFSVRFLETKGTAT